MSDEGRRDTINYYPCTYGRARIQFRGPPVPLDWAYTAVVGGSEVFGKYVEDPFTDQLADMTGRRVVNLGVMNAGIDAFIQDDGLAAVLARAEIVVVQTMGAQNMSNRFYTVHPRRNDRFLRASSALCRLYREVDFSDFAFTRHMLTTLRRTCSKRFAVVAEELSTAWLARMETLLSGISGKCVLLHLEDSRDHGLGPEPCFVTVDQLQALEGKFDKVVQCVVGDGDGEDPLREMVYPETERDAAMRMISVDAHERIAKALARVIRRQDGLAA
ncbi:DUF6473 family protein [Jannaschia marina]|uniref:DUF6473 family protein n=1 Tax=Jannaschia marina TaxID=2741674 RepID=UPI0015CA4A39|nr:DUF6473 family protein [Jannaschia marina]